jgi:hypothetical protein
VNGAVTARHKNSIFRERNLCVQFFLGADCRELITAVAIVCSDCTSRSISVRLFTRYFGARGLVPRVFYSLRIVATPRPKASLSHLSLSLCARAAHARCDCTPRTKQTRPAELSVYQKKRKKKRGSGKAALRWENQSPIAGAGEMRFQWVSSARLVGTLCDIEPSERTGRQPLKPAIID